MEHSEHSAERDFDTPREADDGANSPVFGLPVYSVYSPNNSVRKKTKPRASKGISRHNSLNEAKVLMVTEMRRTDSVVQPDLFHYHNHFEFLGLIGKTKFSEVFRVRHRVTKEIFAVKRSRRGFRTKLQRERCLREIRAVAALPAHPNIVGQYRAWQEGGHFYIQMDYCQGGSLDQLIYPPAPGPAPLSNEELWKVAAEIGRGLEFLHCHDVMHLDIKPENIYRSLDADGDPGPWRIGDFGLAVAKETTDWEEGDGDYVAPELLQIGCEPSPAADVFSLGATLYECATGEKLPRKESSAEAAEVELPCRPEAFVVLVKAMLLTNPAERPLASQVAAYAEMHLRELSGAIQGQITPEVAAVPSGEDFAAVEAGPSSNAADRSLKWMPSLSPLISEGALTPVAASGLIGLTPPNNPVGMTPVSAGAGPSSNGQQKQTQDSQNPTPTLAGASSLRPPAPRPPPLHLPPLQPGATNGHPLSSNRTLDNPNSFRLHRRDAKSPGSDFVSSESYSFSADCETTGSLASDMDFPDIKPMKSRSQRISSLGWEMHSSPDPWQGIYGGPSNAGTPITDEPMYNNSADMNENSPLDAENSPCDGFGTVHSESPDGRSRQQFRRFPTLDSMGSLQPPAPPPPEEIPAPASARDRIVGASDAQQYVSPFETLNSARGLPPPPSAQAEGEGSMRPPPPPGPTGAALVPPLSLPGPGNNLRRKRQHSSRRALVQALKDNGEMASSRSVDLCSSRSLQELMPVRKGARHGGNFHLGSGEEGGDEMSPMNTARPEEEVMPTSGCSTQRSYLGGGGPLTSRTALGLSPPCSARDTSARMANMSLDDGKDV